MKNPIMTIETDRAVIRIELLPESAPNAVSSVIRNAQEGLYDNREIRRIAPGFVIQPSFTCFEDPRLAMEIRAESAAYGYTEGAAMKKGSVAMGADGETASGSEFFFCLTDETAQRLQGRFPVIGYVTEGWEEIERLERVPSHRLYVPDHDEVVVYVPDTPEHMVRVTVETFGLTLPEPEIIGWQKLPESERRSRSEKRHGRNRS